MKMEVLRSKYPTRVPVKVCSKLPLRRDKFLVPHDMDVRALMYVVRKNLNGVGEREALFLNVNGTMPRLGATMVELDKAFCNGQGALTVTVNKESVFG